MFTPHKKKRRAAVTGDLKGVAADTNRVRQASDARRVRFQEDDSVTLDADSTPIRRDTDSTVDSSSIRDSDDRPPVQSSADGRLRSEVESREIPVGGKIKLRASALREINKRNLGFIDREPAKSQYTDWRQTLEDQSQDRSTNPSYLRILSLLDRATKLENTKPLTPENVQEQIDLLEQINRDIPLAASTSRGKKSARNDALTTLQGNIKGQIPILRRQRVDLLRKIESEIRDLGVAKRTPSEVLVHFLHSLQKTRKKGTDSKILKDLEQQIQKMILQHTMTLSETQKVLRQAETDLKSDNQRELAQLTQTLISHLPKDEKSLAPTRLQDNIYGRVFDSGIVSELVKNPPPKVKATMKQAAGAMATMLRVDSSSDDKRNAVAKGMKDYLLTKDPRFWGPLVPSLKALMDAKSPAEETKALLDFLDNPGDDGFAVVSIPYVLVKSANILKQQTKLDWMDKADKNYWDIVTKQTGRTDVPGSSDPEIRFTQANQQLSTGAGITLRHQPNPFVTDGMVPSLRPTLKNMPKFEQDLQFPTDSVATALQHGLVFASGVSGSTNIMLHLLDHLKSQGSDVDVKSFLLGTMMFLVYDGGHSIQEVLWTANQLDKQLNLNLKIGDPDNPNQFVADYERFAALFDIDSTGPILRSAIDTALNDTLNYFAQKSVYSEERGVQPPTSTLSKLDTDQSKSDARSDPSLSDQSKKSGALDASESVSDQVKPPPAPPTIGDLSHPNPALYFKVNDQNGQNLRVDSVNPGEGWVKVEQFCSVLATHWLTKTSGGVLSFADLSDVDRTDAISALSSQSGNGLPAQVQYAEAKLGAASEDLATVNDLLDKQGYPPGTKMWFGNDRHVQAASVPAKDKYLVYDPDRAVPFELSQSDFKQYVKDWGINAFVVKRSSL